jgi:hypothetical protein
MLTKEEVRTCSSLRILPAQYLNMKQVLLTAVENRGPFKKRECQSWFRIDVNKTCLIYDWFRALEWIPSFEDWERSRRLGPAARRTLALERGKNISAGLDDSDF